MKTIKMKMTSYMTLITLLLTWAAPALAYLEIVEEVLEIGLEQARLPNSENGRVIVRECAGCPMQIWRVDADTSYHVGIRGAAVTLDELRRAADSGNHELLYLFIDSNTETVMKIALSLPR